MTGQGPAARSVKLPLPKFTLVGATTRPGLLTSPLRGRFGIHFHLNFYDYDELELIVRRSADLLKTDIDDGGAQEIAPRARRPAHRQPPSAARARLRRGRARWAHHQGGRRRRPEPHGS